MSLSHPNLDITGILRLLADAQNPLSQSDAALQLEGLEITVGFIPMMLQIASSDIPAPTASRLLAATCILNCIRRHWNAKVNLKAISAEEKNICRISVLHHALVCPDDRVSMVLCKAVALIARADWPNNWDSLFPTLGQALGMEGPYEAHGQIASLRSSVVLNKVLKELQTRRVGQQRKNFISLCESLASAIVRQLEQSCERTIGLISTFAHVISTEKKVSPNVLQCGRDLLLSGDIFRCKNLIKISSIIFNESSALFFLGNPLSNLTISGLTASPAQNSRYFYNCSVKEGTVGGVWFSILTKFTLALISHTRTIVSSAITAGIDDECPAVDRLHLSSSTFVSDVLSTLFSKCSQYLSGPSTSPAGGSKADVILEHLLTRSLRSLATVSKNHCLSVLGSYVSPHRVESTNFNFQSFSPLTPDPNVFLVSSLYSQFVLICSQLLVSEERVSLPKGSYIAIINIVENACSTINNALRNRERGLEVYLGVETGLDHLVTSAMSNSVVEAKSSESHPLSLGFSQAPQWLSLCDAALTMLSGHVFSPQHTQQLSKSLVLYALSYSSSECEVAFDHPESAESQYLTDAEASRFDSIRSSSEALLLEIISDPRPEVASAYCDVVFSSLRRDLGAALDAVVLCSKFNESDRLDSLNHQLVQLDASVAYLSLIAADAIAYDIVTTQNWVEMSVLYLVPLLAACGCNVVGVFDLLSQLSCAALDSNLAMYRSEALKRCESVDGLVSKFLPSTAALLVRRVLHLAACMMGVMTQLPDGSLVPLLPRIPSSSSTPSAESGHQVEDLEPEWEREGGLTPIACVYLLSALQFLVTSQSFTANRDTSSGNTTIENKNLSVMSVAAWAATLLQSVDTISHVLGSCSPRDPVFSPQLLGFVARACFTVCGALRTADARAQALEALETVVNLVQKSTVLQCAEALITPLAGVWGGLVGVAGAQAAQRHILGLAALVTRAFLQPLTELSRSPSPPSYENSSVPPSQRDPAASDAARAFVKWAQPLLRAALLNSPTSPNVTLESEGESSAVEECVQLWAELQRLALLARAITPSAADAELEDNWVLLAPALVPLCRNLAAGGPGTRRALRAALHCLAGIIVLHGDRSSSNGRENIAPMIGEVPLWVPRVLLYLSCSELHATLVPELVGATLSHLTNIPIPSMSPSPSNTTSVSPPSPAECVLEDASLAVSAAMGFMAVRTVCGAWVRQQNAAASSQRSGSAAAIMAALRPGAAQASTPTKSPLAWVQSQSCILSPQLETLFGRLDVPTPSTTLASTAPTQRGKPIKVLEFSPFLPKMAHRAVLVGLGEALARLGPGILAPTGFPAAALASHAVLFAASVVPAAKLSSPLVLSAVASAPNQQQFHQQRAQVHATSADLLSVLCTAATSSAFDRTLSGDNPELLNTCASAVALALLLAVAKTALEDAEDAVRAERVSAPSPRVSSVDSTINDNLLILFTQRLALCRGLLLCARASLQAADALRPHVVSQLRSLATSCGSQSLLVSLPLASTSHPFTPQTNSASPSNGDGVGSSLLSGVDLQQSLAALAGVVETSEEWGSSKLYAALSSTAPECAVAVLSGLPSGLCVGGVALTASAGFQPFLGQHVSGAVSEALRALSRPSTLLRIIRRMAKSIGDPSDSSFGQTDDDNLDMEEDTHLRGSTETDYPIGDELYSFWVYSAGRAAPTAAILNSPVISADLS